MIINSNKENFIVKVNDKILSKEEYDFKDNNITFKTTPEPNDKILVLRENDGQTNN